MQQYFGLGSKPITNETLQILRLDHATSFVLEFVANKFINQTEELQELPAGASSRVKALAAVLITPPYIPAGMTGFRWNPLESTGIHWNETGIRQNANKFHRNATGIHWNRY